MLDKSPLKIKKPDLDAQIAFLFQVAGSPALPSVSVPLYWQCGVVEPGVSIADLTRRQLARNRTLQERIAATEFALARYEQKIESERALFLEDAASRAALYAKKEEELRLLHEDARLAQEAELVEKKEELLQMQQENAVREAELDSAKRLANLRKTHEIAEQEIVDRLYATDTAIAAEDRASRELDETLARVKAEFLDSNRTAILHRQANEKQVFEAFDNKNVLEIKDVYLHNNSRDRYALHLPTMSVKAGKITVMSAQNPDVLELTFKVLFRSYSSDLSIRSGEVRYLGTATTSVLKQDFKKTFGNTVNAGRDFVLIAQHSQKNALKTFQPYCDEVLFKQAYQTLGGNAELLKRPLPKLADTDKNLVAFAAAYASKIPLTVFLEPFCSTPDFHARVLTLFNQHPQGKSYLLLTSDTDTVLKLSDFNLYRLEQK